MIQKSVSCRYPAIFPLVLSIVCIVCIELFVISPVLTSVLQVILLYTCIGDRFGLTTVVTVNMLALIFAARFFFFVVHRSKVVCRSWVSLFHGCGPALCGAYPAFTQKLSELRNVFAILISSTRRYAAVLVLDFSSQSDGCVAVDQQLLP